MPKSNGASKRPSVRQVKRAAGIKEPQSAIQVLKADHRAVEGLFKAFEKSKSDADKHALAKKICDELSEHMRIEEEIFYPAFVEATGDENVRNEALVEHQGAKALILEIERGGDDPLFDARVHVLSEMIKHHVKEEERFNGMFAKARRSRMDSRAVGILLEARKHELEKKAGAARAKTPRGTRAAFMGAAALARSRGGKPHARRVP